ncbi:MAG TPA: hypothetical protein VGH34_14390, partial [Vicinamibacterales bacterium]
GDHRITGCKRPDDGNVVNRTALFAARSPFNRYSRINGIGDGCTMVIVAIGAFDPSSSNARAIATSE